MTLNEGVIDQNDRLTIDQFLHLFKNLGTIVGCRLFCTRNPTVLNFFIHLLIFLAVLSIYLFAFITLILTTIPNSSENRNFQLDSSAAFAIVWIFMISDGLGCFITLNYIIKLLNKLLSPVISL